MAARRLSEPTLERFGGVVFAALATVSGVLVFWAARGTTFFGDDWEYVIDRRAWTADTFLRPHNEHISIVPIAIYKILFATVGLRLYWPYRLVDVLAHLGCCAFLFVLVRRRAGTAVALVLASVLLFLGAAWEDLGWAFEVSLVGSVLGGLAAFAAIERRTPVADVAAFAAVLFSIGSSSLGVPVLVGVAVELLLTREWRRLWIVVVPAVLYAAWYVEYARGTTATDAIGSNVAAVPGYVVRAAAAAAGALVGVTGGPAWIVAAVAAVVLLAAVVRCGSTPRLLALAALLLAFWVLAGLTRAQLHAAGSSRYLYVGAAFLLLGAAELAPPARRRPRAALGVVAVVALLGGAANVVHLLHGTAFLRRSSVTLRAQLGALEALRAPIPPGFQPAPDTAVDILAGPYRAAVAALGSPADSPSQLASAPADARTAADRVLLGAAPPVPIPSRGAAAGCRRGKGGTELLVRGGRFSLRSDRPEPLELRRFGDEPVLIDARSVGDQAWHLPLVSGDGAWHVLVPAGATACAAGLRD